MTRRLLLKRAAVAGVGLIAAPMLRAGLETYLVGVTTRLITPGRFGENQIAAGRYNFPLTFGERFHV